MPDPDQRTVAIETATLLCLNVAADLGPADTAVVEGILAIPGETERLRTLHLWIQETLTAAARSRSDS